MWWVARTVDFDQYICIFLSDTISCYVSAASDHLQFRSPKYIHSVPAISSSTLPKNMGMQESLTVFGCATAFAAVGAAVVVSVGLLFAPCGLAVFKVVEGVTTVTVAGRAAVLIVSAAGAGVGAQIGDAVSTRCFIV